jgi:hypothetical protein
MANKLLISENKLKAFTNVNKNVDMDTIRAEIGIAQDIHLQNLLGTLFYDHLLNQISINLNIMNNYNNNELRDTLRHEYLHFLDFICIGKHKLNRNKIESEITEKEVINNLLEDCLKNKSKLSKIYIRQEIKKIKKSLCYDYIGYNNSKNELNVRILVILSNVANIRNYMLDDLNEYVFKELKNDINLDYLHDESISFIKNKIKNIYFLSNKRHF